MENLTKEEFKKISCDVRHAYRLLAEFSKKILSLMEIIESKLNLKFIGGYPKYSAQCPRNGKVNLKNWSWDWFNLYFYEFNFKTKNDLPFSIIIQNDTGFWDSNLQHEQKLDISKYSYSEESKTRLIFVSTTESTWNLANLFKNNNEILSSKSKEDIFDNLYIKIFDLENFIDDQSIDQQINIFKSFLTNKGNNTFEINPIESDDKI